VGFVSITLEEVVIAFVKVNIRFDSLFLVRHLEINNGIDSFLNKEVGHVAPSHCRSVACQIK
jgi:hypothetical protein